MTHSPPPLRCVMWFRLGLGVVACIAMAAVLMSNMGGELALVLLKMGLIILLAVVGLPSVAVAYGLWKRCRWAPGLALVYDIIVILLVMPAVVGQLGEFIKFGGYLTPVIARISAIAAPGLVFAAEACHVARRLWGWRLVWPVYGFIAAGLVLTIAIAPAAAAKRLRRHVDPLLAYINANWFIVPQNARVSIESWPNDSDGHIDRIHLEMDDIDWFLIVHHGVDGRWQFPACGHEGEDTFHGKRHERWRAIRSIEDAQKMLTDSGIADPDLGPGRLVRGEYGTTFQFWSPKGKGSFDVDDFGDIWFRLKDPLEVPAP